MMNLLPALMALAQVEAHGDEAAAGAAAVGVLGFVCCMFVVVIGIQVLICYILYSAQSKLPEQYRQISPGSIWLLLIPIFPIVWNFFVFPKVAASYKAYLDAQGSTDHGDAGQTLGLVYAITAIVAGPVALVVLIIYLVKINGYKNRIGGGPAVTPTPPPAV